MRGLVCAWLTLILILPQRTTATERLQRIFDHHHGLPTDTVSDVAQDAAGFIWVATPGGLVRFDGAEMRRWGGRLGASVTQVRADPDGTVVAVDDQGVLLRALPSGGAEAVRGPDGLPLNQVTDVQFDAGGGLWIARPHELMYRGASGWTRMPVAAFGNETIRRVRPAAGGDAFVMTTASVWRAHPHRPPTRVLAMPWVVDVAERERGVLLTLAGGTVSEHSGGRSRVLVDLPVRGIDLAIRGKTVWASFDRYLVSFPPDTPSIVTGPADGLPSGGRMLVDREGSLWMGTFRGLMQFPEPDTIAWTQQDGLPSSHARYVARGEDGIWIMTWAGLARIDRATGWRVTSLHTQFNSDLCVDAGGRVWYAAAGMLIERGSLRTVEHRVPGSPALSLCAPARDGGIWFSGKDAIVKAASGRQPIVVRNLPRSTIPNGSAWLPLLEDRAARLWIGVPGRVCHAPVEALERDAAEWTCDSWSERLEVFDLLEVAPGSYWLATNTQGVLRRGADGTWSPIAASRDIGGGFVFRLIAAADDSIWVLSLATPIRVVSRPNLPGGWEIVESLSSWHGQPSGGASDLIEEPDGTIWTATAAGVVRTPAAARRATAPPPRVELAGLSMDGQAVPIDALPPLAHRSNLIEIRFAALTYRDRSRVRYQARLGDGDRWTNLVTGEPLLRFPNLPAGRYLAELRASLDGQTWSASGSRVTFSVREPWYRRPWALALALLLGGGALLAVHRTRVAMLLQLERQRMRIAMDLHDEMGSGLGSIGILAGLAGGEVPEAQRRELARDIADTAGELGASLGDIVWSLRRGGNTLQSLGEHLVERASRLFPGPEPALELRLPESWPAIRLSLSVRRNVLLILAEALHNAARHARARRVVVGMKPRGRKWTAWVADDGVGCDASSITGGGLGRETMRRRADEIGASFEWLSVPGRGTTVTIGFDPTAREGRQAAV